MPDPETPEEALKNSSRGDLGRNYPEAQPTVDNALANLMAMVQREENGR